MSKTQTGKTQISRRTVAKGAAWTVPVIATAAAAPAASASVVPGQSSAGPVQVACKLTSPVPLEATWTLTLTATTPTSVSPGDAIPAPSLTATVTTDDQSGDLLRQLGVTSLDGTSTAPYTVSGAIVNPGDRSATLTVPPTDVDPEGTGGLTTTATGAGAGETAGGSAGSIVVTLKPFDISLTAHGGAFDGSNIAGTCTPPDGTVLAPATQVK
ncbi:DUF6801 domain-containing protein [Flexivirga sp. B27]